MNVGRCVRQVTVRCHRLTVTRCWVLLVAITYVALLVTLHGQLENRRHLVPLPSLSSSETVHMSEVRENYCNDSLVETSLQSENCPDVSDIKSGIFQRLPTTLGEYFYSAFVDDRVVQAKFIRIIALLSSRERAHSGVYCHVRVTTATTHTFISTPASYYEMCENHGKPYGGWILSCALPEELYPVQSYPCFVILSKQSTFDHAIDSILDNGVRLAVERRTNKEIDAKKHHFGVCVSPLYGNIPLRTLVQFVELTTLLGANELMFYKLQGVDDDVIRKMLCHYKRTNQISVNNWPIPVDDAYLWYHGQLLAINDCLYRNMHRFEYLVFLDLDEFLIPRKHVTWLDMVQHLREVGHGADVGQGYSAAGIDAYSFQSAFFVPLLDGKSNPLLYDLESDLRVFNLSRVRTKVMVKPTHIYELGIHHVSRTTNEVKAEVVSVSDQVALVHHYRQCTTEYDHSINCAVLVRDDRVASVYGEQLTSNIISSLKLIG